MHLEVIQNSAFTEETWQTVLDYNVPKINFFFIKIFHYLTIAPSWLITTFNTYYYCRGECIVMKLRNYFKLFHFSSNKIVYIIITCISSFLQILRHWKMKFSYLRDDYLDFLSLFGWSGASSVNWWYYVWGIS